MKHAIICGAGKMGVTIAYAMRDYKLSVVETNPQNVERLKAINDKCSFYESWNQIEPKADVVISALPYTENIDVAMWAIKNDLRYCDLGGSVPVSKKIKELSVDAKKPVITDLGLAPGWINIWAEDLYRQCSNADTITMMVGGIPVDKNPEDPLNYMMTWSFEGLLNEYVDDCVIIEDGNIKTVPGLSGVENVIVHGLELEAFYTSGASAHSIEIMKHRRVKNCVYKTLRWRGHADMVKYILSTNSSLLESFLTKSSEKHKKDMVIMSASAVSGGIKLEKSAVVFGNDKFTAMQIATAFPLAAVAKTLAEGKMDYWKVGGYETISSFSFDQHIKQLFERE